MFILISCTVLFVLAVAFLVIKGRYGQRGLVWTARMGDDD